MVISLINRRQITARDFSEQNGKIILGKQGLNLFFETYRKKVNTKFVYKNMRLNYLQIMERQVWHFMRVLKEEDTTYEGYIHR